MLTKQRITNIVESWYLKEPLFFMVWTTHELCINPHISNIRVGQGRVEYNPAFIEALNDKMLYQVLQFEVMRIILKHPYLRRKEIQTLAYVASNITVQEYLQTPLDFPNAKQVFQTEEYDNKYFEFYYFQLLELWEQDSIVIGQFALSNSVELSRIQGMSSNQPGDTQRGSRQNTQTQNIEQYADPNFCGMENTELWETNEYYGNQINDKIEWAFENNSWGTIPARIQERILATLKPKLNYREVLKTFRATILSVNRTLTRMKPSRRYGFLYMGSRRDFCTKLLFAVDVSGSVGTQDIRKAFSIINQLFKYGIESVDVLQFDADIKGKPISLKKAKYKVHVIGRGGTNFQPVINYIDQQKDYDGLIIFTDGWAPIPTAPKNRKTRILWLFNNEYNYTRQKENLKFLGRSTFLKES